MKINSFILLCLMCTVILFTACSEKEGNISSSTLSSSSTSSTLVNESSTVVSQSSNQNSSAASSKQVLKDAESHSEKDTITSSLKDTDIAQKVKSYILSGQEDKPSADKLKWNEVFLNNVDIEGVYEKYISSGGEADNIESFSKYLTQNAPILNNWKKLFEAHILKTYGEKVIRYTHLQDSLYQAYIKMEETEIPYVVVNARTGYFHG